MAGLVGVAHGGILQRGERPVAGGGQHGDQVGPRAHAPGDEARGIEVVLGGVGADKADGRFALLNLPGKQRLARKGIVDGAHGIAPLETLQRRIGLVITLVAGKVAAAMGEQDHRIGPCAVIGQIDVHERPGRTLGIGYVQPFALNITGIQWRIGRAAADVVEPALALVFGDGGGNGV